MNDYDVSIFIVTNDNEYILPNDYVHKDCGEAMFICLTNEEMDQEYKINNSIYIYKEWVNKVQQAKKIMEGRYNVKFGFYYDGIFVSCPWQNVNEVIPNNEDYAMFIRYKTYEWEDRDSKLKHCLEGYESCKNIMMNVVTNDETKEMCIPAIMTAYHTEVVFDNKICKGYLPSIGQLMFISHNNRQINGVLGLIKKDRYKFNVNMDGWWSSTVYFYPTAWHLINGETKHNSKTSYAQILPLFVI